MRRALILVLLAAALPAHAFCLGTVHVHVFDDRNGNGVADAGEAGLAGVVVQEDQLGDGTIEAVKTTDANGDADFTMPAVVPYRFRIVVPPGTTQSTTNPADLTAQCNATTPISFGLVPTIPTTSPRVLVLLAVLLASIAIVRRA